MVGNYEKIKFKLVIIYRNCKESVDWVNEVKIAMIKVVVVNKEKIAMIDEKVEIVIVD